MNKIKQALVIGYRVLTVTVTIIEATDLTKSLWSKYKNKKSVKPTTTPTDTTTKVKTVCD